MANAKKALLLLVFQFVLLSCMRAQEYRATLLGTVTDPAGAAVPEAKVTVTNSETGVAVVTATNQQGTFSAPLLNPGSYTMTVEHIGFKAIVREHIDLQVSANRRVDVQLPVGSVASTVDVTSAPPLVETGTANRELVIDSHEIARLPLNGENPYTLVDLAPGVTHTTSNTKFFRPFDYGAINDFSVNGGPSSRNSLLLDGIPVDVYAGRDQNRVDVSYIPPASATQELSVQTSSYDSQYGRTGGGVVSISTKPGTNSFHGSAYDNLRRTWLNANTYVNNANGSPRVSQQVDQWGGEIAGPIYRDHTFFMSAFEHFGQVDPNPILGTLATAAQRGGDFSKTFRPSGVLNVIYDPLTIRPNPAFNSSKPVSTSNRQYLVDSFPGNLIPSNRIDPVALNILKDLPLPNQPGNAVTGANNWFAGDNTTLNKFNNIIARVDHSFNSKVRGFGRWYRGYRDGGITNASGWDSNACACSHSYRASDGVALNAVGSFNASTVLSATFGWTRYDQGIKRQDLALAQLGFSGALLAQMQAPNQYPNITMNGFLPTGLALKSYNRVPSDTTTAESVLMKVIRQHSFKFGGEFRLIHASNVALTDANGTYNFTEGWTSSGPNVTDTNTGNAFASFLLGYLSAANMGINAAPYLSTRYVAGFVQDDWQLNARLTFNMGLRWDYEAPPTERFNRQDRGFAFDTPSPLAVPGLTLKGGLQFAGVNGLPRGAFNPDLTGWQPRFGVSYRAFKSKPLVIRAGIARYNMPATDYGQTTGFSQTTQALTTLSTTQGPVPNVTLANAFPNGLVQPAGSSLGLLTSVGGPVEFAYQGRTIPSLWTWSAGMQYQLPWKIVLDASYVGSRGRGLEVSKQLNYLTTDQLALGSGVLNQSVPNPFYGVLSKSTTLGAKSTIAARSLMFPYPQFTSVQMDDYSVGKSWYRALQFRAQRRFESGISFLASYTVSKTENASQFLNPQDASPDREIAYYDIPHRLTLSGVAEVPFGRGKRWLHAGVGSYILGGWRVSATADLHPGIPLALPAGYNIVGDPRLTSGQNLNHWFDTSSSIWVPLVADALRPIPFYSPTLRQPSLHQMDGQISRSFRTFREQSFQFMVSAFNLTNTPVFGAPVTTPTSTTFGVVPITQINNPRNIQLGFRYTF